MLVNAQGGVSEQTIELFSGPKIFGSIAEALGYSTFTVDRNRATEPRLAADVLPLIASQLPASLW